MVDFATLSLTIQREQVDAATKSLAALSAQGGMASDMAKRLQADYKTGAISAGQLVQATNQLAPAVGPKLAAAATQGSQGLNKIERSLSALAAQAAGIPGPVGSFATSLLQFGTGGTATLGFVAGFGAMTLAMKAWNAEAEESLQQLRDLYAEADKLRQTALQAALVQRLSAQTALNHAQEEYNRLKAGEFSWQERLRILFDGPSMRVQKDLMAGAGRALATAQLELDAFAKAEAKAGEEGRKLAHELAIMADAVTNYQAALDLLVNRPAQAVTTVAAAGGLSVPGFDLTDKGMDQMVKDAIETGKSVADAIAFGMKLDAPEVDKAFQTLLRDMQRALAGFFDSILSGGVASFADLFDEVRGLFARLVSDMAAQQIMSKATGGAVAGAAAGSFAAGPGLPIAVGVLAIGALASAIHGASEAAKQAAENMKKLQESFGRNLGQTRNEIELTGLDKALADSALRFQDLRKAAAEAFPPNKGATYEEYARQIAEINRLEALRIEQIKAEAEAVEAANKVRAFRQFEDLDVRMLNAQGRGDEAERMAFYRQQEREYQDAIVAGMDEVYLARLREVQVQEFLRRDIDKYVDAKQRELDATKASLEQTTLTVKTLRDFALQLRGGAGSPIQNLDFARKQFEDTAALARAGDQVAAGKLPGLGQALLDLSRQFNASGMGYQTDLQHVLSIVDQLGDQYDVQRNLEQMQVDALQAMLAEMQVWTGTWTAFMQKFGGLNISLPIVDPDAAPVAGGVSPVVAVLQDGFTTLGAKLDQQNTKIEENTTQLQRGLEGLKLLV